MNIIILSGGSGKRLWPLSNDIRSKQFIKMFKTANGEYESMIQRVYRQIKEVDAEANITIATAESQVPSIKNQLGEKVAISIEPSRRDTFPAIALAAAYLVDVRKLDRSEPVIICPVDPFVESEYFRALKDLGKQILSDEANLVLMGIEPTYPSEKYGYILPEDKKAVSFVKEFKEKPSEEKAREYIVQGALWNAGVFACRLSYLLDKAKELLGVSDYKKMYSDYSNLKKISFDYAVVEAETSIKVVRFAGEWKDVGTWNTLAEALDVPIIGNGIISDSSENVHILNELDMPIFAMGVNNLVISASPQGILVSDKHQSSYIKPYVDSIEQMVMYAENEWGSYKILDITKKKVTYKVVLNAGKRFNPHSLVDGDMVVTVIEGNGCLVSDERDSLVFEGNSVHISTDQNAFFVADGETTLIIIKIDD